MAFDSCSPPGQARCCSWPAVQAHRAAAAPEPAGPAPAVRRAPPVRRAPRGRRCGGYDGRRRGDWWPRRCGRPRRCRRDGGTGGATAGSGVAGSTGGQAGRGGSGASAGRGGAGGSSGLAGSSGASGSVGTGGSGAPGSCPADGWKPGDQQKLTLTFGGLDRTYDIHIPASYTGTTPVPLVHDDPRRPQHDRDGSRLVEDESGLRPERVHRRVPAGCRLLERGIHDRRLRRRARRRRIPQGCRRRCREPRVHRPEARVCHRYLERIDDVPVPRMPGIGRFRGGGRCCRRSAMPYDPRARSRSSTCTAPRT